MPGGKEKTTQSGSLRSTQAARKASTTQTSEKSAKHTLSDVSSVSETSFESGHLTDELGSIKRQLLEIPTKKDIESLRESLVGRDELKTLVTDIVKGVFVAFEEKIHEEMEKRVERLREECDNKIQALELENESLTNELKTVREANLKLKSEVNTNKTIAQEALKAANFNEQYSRKNNIKIFNLRTTPKQDLRQDLVTLVEKDLNVKLDPSDISAIHRIPSKNQNLRDNPVIVRFSCAEAKVEIMKHKKNLKNNVHFTEDVTKRNLELMRRIRESEGMESAWYFNTSVYGKTKSGLQMKFDLFDNVEQRIQKESNRQKR